jgi:hypothetical protein
MLVGSLQPTSNREDWTVFYELTDGETGELIDLSGVDEITVHVRDKHGRSLTATLGSGVTVVDTGVFSWTFTEAQMRTLQAKTYEVGCTLKSEDQTVQLLIGTLPVLDGIVR